MTCADFVNTTKNTKIHEEIIDYVLVFFVTFVVKRIYTYFLMNRQNLR